MRHWSGALPAKTPYDAAMPTIRRLTFTGLEYAFAPEKAYGMSRGGGFRRPV
jgi:hypothetical protein